MHCQACSCRPAADKSRISPLVPVSGRWSLIPGPRSLVPCVLLLVHGPLSLGLSQGRMCCPKGFGTCPVLWGCPRDLGVWGFGVAPGAEGSPLGKVSPLQIEAPTQKCCGAITCNTCPRLGNGPMDSACFLSFPTLCPPPSPPQNQRFEHHVGTWVAEGSEFPFEDTQEVRKW